MSSGNNNSNFTKAVIVAFRDQELLEVKEEDFDEAEEDDVFGVEKAALVLTNSIVTVYLHLWLNKRPGFNLLSRQIL